jgi:SAM-dependent methyltransferase
VVPEVVTVTQQNTAQAADPERAPQDASAGAPAHPDLDQAFWNERYRSRTTLWSGHANPQLVSDAARLTPGAALDVGCGEGGDAIWLAEHGWQVTAVDFSQVALDRGAARARELGAETARRITWQQADITAWTPAPGSYDLVSEQYVHLPREQREALHRRLGAAVAPGGVLLVVAHHPSDLQTTVPRPNIPERFYTPAEVASVLDPREWTVLAEEARPRTAIDPEGREVTIHDTVLAARRTA